MFAIYQTDLAHIHIDGYGFHLQGAAPAILTWLRKAGIRKGQVVDLGCGGGQWLKWLADRGYAPVGVDLSAAMIRSARKLVPKAELICGSFADLELPPCDAVTSLGEPLIYLPNRTQFQRTLKHVHRALRPGGLFIFDVRVPATKPVPPRVHTRTGNDWACISTIEEDHLAGRITRQITTFRRRGRTYRRGDEMHQLCLYSKQQILTWLRGLGFRVRTTRSYGDYHLGSRQIVFIARKPAA